MFKTRPQQIQEFYIPIHIRYIMIYLEKNPRKLDL